MAVSQRGNVENSYRKKIQSHIKGYGNMAKCFLKIKDLMIRSIPLIK